MAPIDLVKVLTAAAPIVASLATIANKSENTEKKENKEDNEKRVNVNIYNTFYTHSEKDAEMAAATISKQLIRGVTYSDNHYSL
jgi:hypothetical protein